MRITNKLTIVATTLATIAVFAFTACRKNTAGEDTAIATDHATLEKTFSDVQSITDQAGASGSLSTYKMTAGQPLFSSCAKVTNDTISNPHVLTIAFPDSNCLCADGIYRRGKIIVSYSGHYRDAGSTHTITFSNYFVNDNGVSGSKTVTNTGNNSSGQPVYTVSVNGSIALANNNGNVSWTSNRTRTWISGYNTADWSDDVYEITGTANVTRANGNTFAINITTPLHVALNCRWIESGTVQVTPSGSTARTLDYGNGVCDALATYTVNGKVYNITLK